MAEAVPVFTTSAPRIRKIELDRPWQWLAAGWRDLSRAPYISLAYGVIFAAVGYAITLGLWLSGLTKPGPADGLRLHHRRIADGGPPLRGQPAAGDRRGGLIVTPPLIGHATWHAYRDLVDHQS